MPNPEGERAEGQGAARMLRRHEDCPEAAVRPRDIGLHTAVQPRSVPAFCLARHESRQREATISAKLFAKRPECNFGTCGKPAKILGEGVIVKPDRKHRFRPVAGHAQPSSSLGSDPKRRSN